MMIHLLLVLVAAQSPQQPDQQLQRQQVQLEQLRQELQQQRQQFRRLLDLLEQQGQKQQQTPVYSAELRRVNGGEFKRVPPNISAVVPLVLLSTISKPQEACLQAEIRVTAHYLDTDDKLICSGIVENVATQNSLTQNINLDIRPWNLREFVRWRNEPAQTNSGSRRLVCLNADGLNEATSEELERAASVRIDAIVLPRDGGLSTTDIQISR